jgi:hypothetical protein
MLEGNAILASLPESDASSIRPNLKPVHLSQKTVLFEAGTPIKSVNFPVTAVISLVIGLETGGMTESAMVGRDGAVCIASALTERSLRAGESFSSAVMLCFALLVHSKA